MAETMSIPIVTGSRSAMDAVGPRPGRTPITVPESDPRNTYRRFAGVRATANPWNRASEGIHAQLLDLRHQPWGSGIIPSGRGTFSSDAEEDERDRPRRQAAIPNFARQERASTQRNWMTSRIVVAATVAQRLQRHHIERQRAKRNA